MRILGITLAAVLSLVSIARSEPLNTKQVAPDAKWVAHVDVDAARQSIVVQKAYQKCSEMHKDAAKHMDKLRGMIGMDIRKDLHGITVYGKDTDKKHGVMLVNADVDEKLLLEKAAKAPDHKVVEYGKYKLHSWTSKCGKTPHTAFGTICKPNLVVFAASADTLKAALDVIDGKAAADDGKNTVLSTRIRPGTIFLARASEINPKTRCPILMQAESFRVALGESQGESFYRARFVMKSPEAVDQVKAVMDGFRAMVSLRHGSDAEAMKLVNAVKATSEGKTLNVRWSAPANDVWAMAEKLGKRIAEMKGKKPGKMQSCPLHGDAHKGKSCPEAEKKDEKKAEKAK